MLSTPTAKTKKGMTSTMMRVAGIPKYENAPRDDITDIRTIRTPTRPNVNLESTYRKLNSL